MQQFQHTFTGKDTAVILPSGERLDKAQENMSKLITDAEKIKLEEFKKNEEWLVKASTVDMKALISAGATATQTKFYDKFINDTTAIVKQAGGLGKLNADQKIAIARARKFYDAEQNKLLGDQKKYEMAEQIAMKDPKYDYVRFLKENGASFALTGTYNNAPIPLKAKSLGAFFDKNKVTGTPTPAITQYRTNELGKKEQKDFVYRATDKEARDYVANNILNDPQLLEGAFEEFSALPESEQWKYFSTYDTDKSGTLSEQEKSFIPDSQSKDINNPILKYAQDKYFEQVRVPEDSAWRQALPPSKGKGGGFSINIGGADLIVSPAVKRDMPVTYGDKMYSDSYAFGGNTTLSNLPTLGGIRYKGTATRDMKAGNITGKLKDYIPSEDLIIIEAATGIPELGVEPKGLVGIPARQIEGADNLPIIVNGKQSNIGALKGGISSTPVKKKAY